MGEVLVETKTGCYIDGMPNEKYHQLSQGISTSVIKDFMDDPGAVIWGQEAPQDPEKLACLDFGEDFHAYFLEPERFKEKYQVLPKFNRKKPAEKQEELDLIAEWKDQGIIPVTNEDMIKLDAMRTSALSHPTVKAIMSMDGVAERSFFWNDPATGLLCKCRPDWLVTDINDSNRPLWMPDDCNILVADPKTIADISKIQSRIEELKYFVQEPFYKNGISHVLGGKVCFAFIFVSTSLSLGRYRVKVVTMTPTASFDGQQKIRDALKQYKLYDESDSNRVWETVVEMERPYWATRDDEFAL